ncbi:tetratricopeptide repeat-containing sulfotransferase family protein [Thermomonas mangrovi]|uniref:tetratricopeptide repeat-containing sulfotransferase family protein n=1 Tax=Thermomonas mangrovi TaxID=2993316 RepID=UPI002307C13A|nr:sulfotransferase [Thermomonas mangrovi]
MTQQQPDPMRRLLAAAAPAADTRDMEALRGWLAGIAIEDEAKAARLLEVSYQLSAGGEYRDARTAAMLAASLRPRTAKTRVDLAARLRTFNEGRLLQALVAGAGAASSMPIPLLLGFAAQWSYLNRQQAALALLDEAWRADPDYPPTIVSRGQVLTYLGRLEEARECFERCIKRAPRLAQAHWFLAHVGKAVPGREHVARLRAALQAPGIAAGDIASFAFALHKELDDLGDHAGAWEALDQACRAKRGTLKYDPSDSQRLFEALEAWRPGAEPPPMPAAGAKAPVFIVGMHRSGTTLLEQLLDASPQVRGVGELYDFTSAMRFATDHHCRGVIDRTIVERAGDVDFDDVGRRYLEGMAWRLGDEPLFTDKLPSNFLNIGFICRALPQARILHMVRDPLETCFSNLRELFSDANPYSYDQAELADYFIRYRRLMAHWHALFPGRILDVDYGELTRDPETVMRRVAAFCGIDYVPGMRDPRSSTRAVATASAVQVREGVVRRETPKWAPYARQLQPLADALRAGGIALPGI